jgi:menaquinone reductase, multiheme cytochrome c subunit
MIVTMERLRFPAWLDRLLPWGAAVAALLMVYVAGILFVGAAPATLDVGYKPQQPLPFSHALHAGKLKMDCRFCHISVEQAGFAAVPATATCAKCHSGVDMNGVATTTSIHANSPKLLAVRDSLATGQPIRWTKVHDLADYAYFNHSAHVARGVSCVSCHGRVDQMDEVKQVKELSMAWCLECHRNPTPHLRPKEFVTQLDWVAPENPQVLGEKLRETLQIHPQENCSTCHR